MRIFSSKPAMRLLAPLAFVLVLGGTGLVATTASAENNLPARSPQELLVDLQQAKTDGLSGTVVERADLGIPTIPSPNGQDDPELTSLVSGTHTIRVRYSAPDKARLAVLGTYSEYDIIKNGADVWTWSSKDNTATHRRVTAEPESSPSSTPTTPEEAANRVLKMLEPTTTVTSDSSVEVAGRPAYELVLDPNDSTTLISQVRIARRLPRSSRARCPMPKTVNGPRRRAKPPRSSARAGLPSASPRSVICKTAKPISSSRRFATSCSRCRVRGAPGGCLPVPPSRRCGPTMVDWLSARFVPM